ncbi:MAG: hypothetical protein P8R37_11670 [Opitutae bacterium]|nr:hypothetical protein [Opitutae bacterium]
MSNPLFQFGDEASFIFLSMRRNFVARALLFYLLSFIVPVVPAVGDQVDIVLFGDSLINGTKRLALPLLQNLEQNRTISGAGFCTFVDSSGPADIGMMYLRSPTGWTEVDQSSSSIGLNIGHLQSSTVGATISFSVTSDVD